MLSAECCRVPRGPAGVGVEGVGSWRGQRRPHGIEIPTPLAGVAAHELESSVDGGAAFNPVVVASAATPARCSASKNGPRTATSAAASSSSSANAVSSRPSRFYLGTAIAETSKEDAMEPEVKEEDERRSSTPSPEVTDHPFLDLHLAAFFILRIQPCQFLRFRFLNRIPVSAACLEWPRRN